MLIWQPLASFTLTNCLTCQSRVINDHMTSLLLKTVPQHVPGLILILFIYNFFQIRIHTTLATFKNLKFHFKKSERTEDMMMIPELYVSTSSAE